MILDLKVITFALQRKTSFFHAFEHSSVQVFTR